MIVNGKKVKGVRRQSRTCLVYHFEDGSDMKLFDRDDGQFLDWKEKEVQRELSGGVMVNNAPANTLQKQLLDLLVANTTTDEVLPLPSFDPAMVQNQGRKPAEKRQQPVLNTSDEHLLLPVYEFSATS